jgi:hypothetical protein
MASEHCGSTCVACGGAPTTTGGGTGGGTTGSCNPSLTGGCSITETACNCDAECGVSSCLLACENGKCCGDPGYQPVSVCTTPGNVIGAGTSPECCTGHCTVYNNGVANYSRCD